MKRMLMCSIGVFSNLLLATQVPIFSGKSFSGEMFKFPKYFEDKQKTLVSFWASWCEPCQEELKILNAYMELKREQWQIVSVNVDSGETSSAALKIQKKMKLKFPVILDSSSELFSKLNPSKTLPYSVVVNGSGSIERAIEGFHQDTLKSMLGLE